MPLADVHILVTGGAGQVGQELLALDWPAGVILYAPSRGELDLCDPPAVTEWFASRPLSAVINAAAHTAVDRAENEVAAAFTANAIGPAVLSDLTRTAGIPIVHVSTDYVFDGLKPGYYDEDDAVGPLSVYGASKLAGELAILSGNPRSVVLRTAWVLSVHRANFLKTMLRLAIDRLTLRVVDDQYGCPTSARDIAAALQTIALRMIDDPTAPVGVYHFVNDGDTTWAGLAREIFSVSLASGGPSADVQAIPTAEYPTPAARPINSRLACAKITRDYEIAPRPWRTAVAEIVTALNAERNAA